MNRENPRNASMVVQGSLGLYFFVSRHGLYQKNKTLLLMIGGYTALTAW
jgi:hypothetical protein